MAAPVTQSEIQDAFVHELAIKLSRALNTINPNSLLDRRVIDIAKNNSEQGFIQGNFLPCLSGFLPFNTAFLQIKKNKIKTTWHSIKGLWKIQRFVLI